MVFQRISVPDEKENLMPMDLANVLVRRLGLKRKESRADHAMLMLEMLKYKKENIPIAIEKIAQILGVSQSQTYEELRKWRTLGLIEFVKMPVGQGFVKGYMLSGTTVNRLIDKVEVNFKSFVRKTRRIAKDFDDLIGLEAVRQSKEPVKEMQGQDIDKLKEEIKESNENSKKEQPKEDDKKE
ncbi:MAG: hypothetical protein HZB65_04035 [Candidatus Aenigmarchaeota archaeon]|nr:hypothetical protein [Candidatus Aenigmarchaeota archaeon]